MRAVARLLARLAESHRLQTHLLNLREPVGRRQYRFVETTTAELLHLVKVLRRLASQMSHDSPGPLFDGKRSLLPQPPKPPLTARLAASSPALIFVIGIQTRF